MNKIERYVYDLVKRHPPLKRKLRNTYQNLASLLREPQLEHRGELQVFEGLFFGFHDLRQMSLNDAMFLANRASFDLRMPRQGDCLEVGYVINEEDQGFQSLATSKTWNWHMGCRLQWGPKDEWVIFNDSRKGRLISRVVDLSGKEQMAAQYPISVVDPSAEFAIGYDFLAVEQYMPGYGYQKWCGAMSSPDVERSLYRVNMADGKLEWSLTYEELIKLLEIQVPSGWDFFITHATVSPDGRKIGFLARSSCPKRERRESALIIIDAAGRLISRLSTGTMVSHYCWIDEERVLTYCAVSETKDAYGLFSVQSGSLLDQLSAELLPSDGHPTQGPGEHFYTDTYPDRFRMSKLMKVSINPYKVETLANIPSDKRFQSPDIHSHWSCDLHPRISPTETFLSFDSCHTGKRSTCLLKLAAYGSEP